MVQNVFLIDGVINDVRQLIMYYSSELFSVMTLKIKKSFHFVNSFVLMYEGDGQNLHKTYVRRHLSLSIEGYRQPLSVV